MVKEMLKDFRFEEEREQQAVDSAPEMGGVADVIGVPFGHIPAVKEVQRCKDVAWNRNGNQVDVDAHFGLEKDTAPEAPTAL